MQDSKALGCLGGTIVLAGMAVGMGADNSSVCTLELHIWNYNFSRRNLLLGPVQID